MSLIQKIVIILFLFFIMIISIGVYGLFSLESTLKETQLVHENMASYMKDITQTSSLDNIQNIRYYNEVLLHTVENYALTINSLWKKKYLDTFDLLRKETEKSNNQEHENFFSSIHEAKQNITTANTKIIALVDSQKTQESITIINSSSYQKDKDFLRNAFTEYILEKSGQREAIFLNVQNFLQGNFTENDNVWNKYLKISIIFMIVLFIFCFSFTSFLSKNIDGNITKKIDEVKKTSNKLLLSSNGIITENSQVETNTKKQIQSIDALEKSLEGFEAATIKNVSKINEAQNISLELLDIADISTHEIQQVSAAINAINTSTSDLTNSIKLINNVAFQTNVLALNASVEAAHAGDYGKGFTVVANEVRELASRTTQSAKEMSLKINSVFKQTENSVAIVVQVTNSLQNTLGKLEKLYQLIKTMLDENETQQQSFQRVNSNIESFGTIAQNNQQKVQEVTKLSQTIAVSSENLKNLMYTLSRSL